MVKKTTCFLIITVHYKDFQQKYIFFLHMTFQKGYRPIFLGEKSFALGFFSCFRAFFGLKIASKTTLFLRKNKEKWDLSRKIAFKPFEIFSEKLFSTFKHARFSLFFILLVSCRC